MRIWRLAAAVIGTAFSAACAPHSVAPSAEPRGSIPADFGFRFQYRACIQYTLDTFSGTYSRAEGARPPRTVQVNLTSEEMEQIYTYLREIRFFSYPERYRVRVWPGRTVSMIVPYSKYRLEVRSDGRSETVQWTNEVQQPQPAAYRQLLDLAEMIRQQVEEKQAVQALPEPRVACL